MRPLQRRIAHVAGCAALAAASFAADTSKTNRIHLDCPPPDRVRVRIFDEQGTLLHDTDLTVVNNEATDRDDHNATAMQRYVTTSASKGCVQGKPDTDETNAPIHLFRMPCNPDAPIDLVITASPPAQFAVRRQVPPRTEPTPCQWQEQLTDGSSVAFVTSDQKLVIKASELGGKHNGYLELDWSRLRAQKTFWRPAYPGQHNAEPSEAAKALALNRITIDPRKRP